MVTIRGGSFTNEDLRQAKEVADKVAEVTEYNMPYFETRQDFAEPQNRLLKKFSPANKPQVEIAARGLLGGYDPDFGEEMGTEVFSPQGLANTQGLASIGVDDFTDLAMRTRPFVPIAQPPAPPEGTPNVGQGFDPKNTGVSSTVKGLAELLGYNMDSREGLAEYFRDTALADKAYRDQQEMRNKDRDRALAAAALAAQNQPVDPCPEGYRLDPVSRVCVPTDDMTTDPVPGTGRVYETMTAPQENYTAASNFAVPTINLPDIFTGK
tara:strand:+ start:739 stop:1539 length:801 start_codon:yes stop_codon:yes gene_type:complete